MGGRSSKVVITPETKASAAAPEPTATITKTVMENGNTEAIPSIDEPTTEPNGDCSASAAPAEAPTDTAPAVAECHEPKPELPEAPVGDVETQSAETTQVDQATSHPDPADSCSGPVVEFAPTTNGFHSQVGEEHFVEETSAPANEPVAECAAEESNTDLGLTEKLANLGIDSAQPAQTNGVADHATNVDTEVRND
uniref:Proteoglycan 4-like n=1 Tax=Mesocestoides corti TaxID=53468 RepID=A0A5K3FHH0_MESCO